MAGPATANHVYDILAPPPTRGAGATDDPPSRWGELLAANVEDIRRVELQWASGSGAYRTYKDYPSRPVELMVSTGGNRFVLELDDGQYGPTELAARLWHEGREKFDEENAKRGGLLRELRFSLVAFSADGRIDDHGTKMHPLTESAAAGPVDVSDLAPANEKGGHSRALDYQAAAIMREQRAQTRELVGTVHSLLSRIEGMASNIGQLVDGVVAQSAVALQIQQSAIDRERELVEDERDAAINTAIIDRGFDLADKYAGAFFIMRGVDPSTFQPVDPTTDTPVRDLARRICEQLDEQTWIRLVSIHAETFGDLRTALRLDDEQELRAALTVALPPVRRYGAQAVPLLPPGVIPLLEQLRQLVFPDM